MRDWKIRTAEGERRVLPSSHSFDHLALLVSSPLFFFASPCGAFRLLFCLILAWRFPILHRGCKKKPSIYETRVVKKYFERYGDKGMASDISEHLQQARKEARPMAHVNKL